MNKNTLRSLKFRTLWSNISAKLKPNTIILFSVSVSGQDGFKSWKNEDRKSGDTLPLNIGDKNNCMPPIPLPQNLDTVARKKFLLCDKNGIFKNAKIFSPLCRNFVSLLLTLILIKNYFRRQQILKLHTKPWKDI